MCCPSTIARARRLQALALSDPEEPASVAMIRAIMWLACSRIHWPHTDDRPSGDQEVQSRSASRRGRIVIYTNSTRRRPSRSRCGASRGGRSPPRRPGNRQMHMSMACSSRAAHLAEQVIAPDGPRSHLNTGEVAEEVDVGAIPATSTRARGSLPRSSMKVREVLDEPTFRDGGASFGSPGPSASSVDSSRCPTRVTALMGKARQRRRRHCTHPSNSTDSRSRSLSARTDARRLPPPSEEQPNTSPNL